MVYKNKRVLVVVPARGGSKGIPKKNLRKIRNKSLIQIVAECIKNCKFIDEAVLSSDSEEIINEAKKFGLNAYFKRPKNISGDKISDIPVLKHALNEAEKYNDCKYDIIVMLQPTAPLRTPKDIEGIIKKIIIEDLDTVWTVHEVEQSFHPNKQLKINKLGYIDFYTKKGSEIITRQQLDKSFMKNGIGYALNKNTLVKKGSLLGQKSGFILHDGPIVNIDKEDDIVKAEIFMNESYKL